MKRQLLLPYLASIVLTALLLQAWQAVADARLIEPVFFAGPDAVWRSILRGVESGQLTQAILETTERMMIGWALASLAGILLGSIVGMSQLAQMYVQPSLELLRPLPASAFIPVAIAIFGLSDGMILGVVAFGSLWPTLLATTHGVINVKPRLREVAAVLGLSNTRFLIQVALPSAMPMILSGMRLSLTTALILAVVGEMLSSKPGLGQWVLLAGRSFKPDDLFAGIVILSVLGFLAAIALAAIESRVLRWRGHRA